MSMRNPEAVIRLNGPKSLILSVPQLLGYHPYERVVLVWLQPSGPRRKVALTMAFEIEHWADVNRTIEAGLNLPDEVDACIPVVYYPTPPPEGEGKLARYVNEQGKALEAACTARGFDVMDALWVTGNRYWSLFCQDDMCCPPEGRAIAEEDADAISAEFVGWGVPVPNQSREEVLATLRTREEAYADLIEDADVEDQALYQAAEALMGVYPQSSDPIVEHGADEVSQVVSDYQAGVLNSIVALYGDRPAEMTRDTVLSALACSTNLLVRDWMLTKLVTEDAEADRWFNVLLHIGTHTVTRSTGYFLSAWGMGRYLQGNGMLAGEAADKALEFNPANKLAQLILQAISKAVQPSVLRSAIDVGIKLTPAVNAFSEEKIA